MIGNEQDRRSKLKQKYIRGTKKTLYGGNYAVSITSASGTGFSKLDIVGSSAFTKRSNTQILAYYIENYGQTYSAGVTGAVCMPLPTFLDGKEITVSAENSEGITGFELYLSDGSDYLFSNTELLLDKEGNAYSVTGNTFTYFIALCDDTSLLEDVKERLFKKIVLNLTCSEEISCDYKYTVRNVGDNLNAYLFGKNLVPPLNTLQKSIRLGAITGAGADYVKFRFTTVNGKLLIRLPMEKYFSGRRICFSATIKRTTQTQGCKMMIAWINDSGIITPAAEAAFGEGLEQSVKGYLSFTDYSSYGQQLYLVFDANQVSSSLNQLITVSNIQIEVGNLVTDYEPYKAPVCIEITGVRLGYGDSLTIDRETGTSTHKRQYKEWDLSKPLSEQEKYETPVVEDISNLLFVKELKDLRLDYLENGTMIMDTHFNLQYYTAEGTEECSLTINFVDKEGNQISEPKQYSVRLGAGYQISPPYISGYVSISGAITGKVTDDTEINLIYERE